MKALWNEIGFSPWIDPKEEQEVSKIEIVLLHFVICIVNVAPTILSPTEPCLTMKVLFGGSFSSA